MCWAGLSQGSSPGWELRLDLTVKAPLVPTERMWVFPMFIGLFGASQEMLRDAPAREDSDQGAAF